MDFARLRSGIDLWQAIEDKKKQYQGQTYVDYSFHVDLRHPGGGPPLEILDQLKDVIAAGFPSIKVFMTNCQPGRPPQMVDVGHISGIMEKLAAHEGILMVHVEDDDIVMYNYKKFKHEGRVDLQYMHLVHSNLSEEIAARRLIQMAERLGCPVYLAHLNAKKVVQAIAEARGKGLPVYGETILGYMSYNCEAYKRPEGALYHTYPSLKSEEDRLAVWRGLMEGSLSTVATDESYYGKAEKMRGRTIFDTAGGCESVEVRMGITYSDGVVKRGMSLERFVDLTSTNAAKITGLYPQKGAIAPGSDADIAVIDPNIHKKLALSDLHGDDYSIFEGWQIDGWPVMTILRGKPIVENGKLLAERGSGKLIPRKIAPSVLKHPTC